jgi:accessory gene regulator protein AgrB
MFMPFHRILKNRFYLATALLVLLFILDIFASEQALYWTYRWFDIPMHFMGGALVSWVWFVILSWHKKNLDINWFQAIAGTILIGVLWEIVEFYTKSSPFMSEYSVDNIKDLLMDTAGGLVAYVVWDLNSSGKYLENESMQGKYHQNNVE